MIGPGRHACFGRFHARQTMIPCVAYQSDYPVDIVFDAAGDVAQSRMGAHQHHHVWKAFDQDTKISPRPACPLILQLLSACSSEVDTVKATGNGIETRCIDDDVELVFSVTGP